MPVGKHDNVPTAISLLARQGSDRFLLDTLLALYATVQEEDKATIEQISKMSDVNTDAAELAKEKVCILSSVVSISNCNSQHWKRAHSLNVQGNAAYKAKDYKKAIGHYNDAIRMDGNNAAYYNNRALTYLQLNK